MDYWYALPDETWCRVVEMLSPGDFCALARTCRRGRDLVDEIAEQYLSRADSIFGRYASIAMEPIEKLIRHDRTTARGIASTLTKKLDRFLRRVTYYASARHLAPHKRIRAAYVMRAEHAISEVDKLFAANVRAIYKYELEHFVMVTTNCLVYDFIALFCDRMQNPLIPFSHTNLHEKPSREGVRERMKESTTTVDKWKCVLARIQMQIEAGNWFLQMGSTGDYPRVLKGIKVDSPRCFCSDLARTLTMCSVSELRKLASPSLLWIKEVINLDNAIRHSFSRSLETVLVKPPSTWDVIMAYVPFVTRPAAIENQLAKVRDDDSAYDSDVEDVSIPA